MRNLKHSIVAMIAVAMISSLAVTQAADLTKEKGQAGLLHQAVNGGSILIEEPEKEMEDAEQNITDKGIVDGEVPELETLELEENYTPEEVQEIAAQKSNLQTSYVMLTSGELEVRETPSDEAAIVDKLDANVEVEILESTEGWYKIGYSGTKTGYVQSGFITEEKETAEYAAKHYDNYKKATVTTNGGAIRLRAEASTESDIIGQLENGTPVIVLWGEDEFIRVCYGENYAEGYVINTALTLTNEWIPKNEVAKKQKEAADEKAAAKKKAEQDAAKKADAEKKAKEAATQRKAATTFSAQKNAEAKENSSAPASSKGQAIVNEAKKYLGVKYVWGGTSPKGFDCSGLVQYVCAKNGISVSRTSSSQYGNGKAVSKSNLQPGDLVFFAKNGRIHHVGIYVGDGQMIHAPQTGDVVKISSLNTAYRQKEYVGARRVY